MYCLSLVIYCFLRSIPLSWALALGRILGLIIWFIPGKRKKALLNIKQAFPEKSFAELRPLVRNSFLSFGLSLVETFLMDRVKHRVQVEYEVPLDKKGQIVVGVHQASWEVYNAWFAQNHDFAVLVRDQKHHQLNRLLNALRRRNNITLCNSLKELIGFLDRGYWTGVMVDHGAEKSAVVSEFFGHRVPTPGGAVRLAKKYKRKIYPSFGLRRKNGHLIKFARPIDPDGKSEAEILQELNRLYERFLRQHPDQYLWTYKRFKRKEDRRVLILSDGKVGHLKQTMALFSHLEKASKEITHDLLEIRYRFSFFRTMAYICALFSGHACRGCGACLRLLLPSRLYRHLSGNYYDIVLSTGSSVAPLNRILSCFYGARSAVVLKPGLPAGYFDCLVVPEHDRISGPAVFATRGALSRPANIETEAERGRAFFSLTPGRKVVLCVGNFQNDKKRFCFNLKVFLDRLTAFCSEQDYRLLVTTSRRTSPEVEEILEQTLSGFPRTEVFINVRKKNYAFVIPAFLFYGDIVFVTAESVSMISESLALDKTTVCLFLERIKKRQHQRFLRSLKDGFANFSQYPYNDFSFKKPARSLQKENEAVLRKAIEKIL